MSNENVVSNSIETLQQEQTKIIESQTRPTDYNAPDRIAEVKVYQEKETNKWVKEEQEIESKSKDDRQLVAIEQNIIDSPADMQQSCAIIDNQIIAINLQINGLKAQIATLSAEATAGNCWPGIACSALNLNPTICNPAGIVKDYSTKTTIKEDQELISIYPNLAGPTVDYAASNPFAGDTTIALSASYAGYGYENTKSDDSGTTLTTGGRYDISGTQSDHQSRIVQTIGLTNYRYLGAGVAPYASNTSMTPARCVEIKNQIDSLTSQITTLRAQRDSQNRASLNIIKDKKTSNEVRSWGLLKSRNTVEQLKIDNETAISALQTLL